MHVCLEIRPRCEAPQWDDLGRGAPPHFIQLVLEVNDEIGQLGEGSLQEVAPPPEDLHVRPGPAPLLAAPHALRLFQPELDLCTSCRGQRRLQPDGANVKGVNTV